MDTITTRRARASDSASLAEVALKSYLPYVALMGGQRPAPMDADYAGSIARDLVWVAEVEDGFDRVFYEKSLDPAEKTQVPGATWRLQDES